MEALDRVYGTAPILEGRPEPQFFQGQQVSIREKPGSLTHSLVGVIISPPRWNEDWAQWEYEVRVSNLPEVTQGRKTDEKGGDSGTTSITQKSQNMWVLEQSLLAG